MYIIPLHTANKEVLRKGFVKLIDCMPRQVPLEAKRLNCDSAIVQAARVSYGQGLQDFDTDKNLIKYLYKNKHTSPFEMIKFKFHIKAPLFVARQWFRHRMSNYNEISGKYSILNEDIYRPIKISSQLKIDNILKDEIINDLFSHYMKGASTQYSLYNLLMSKGVSREIAKIALPLNLFTEFYWCIDLHNLIKFIKLRNSNYVQKEIKEYTQAIESIIEPLCPITTKVCNEYKTIVFSPEQIKCLNISESKADKLKKQEYVELQNLIK